MVLCKRTTNKIKSKVNKILKSIKSSYKASARLARKVPMTPVRYAILTLAAVLLILNLPYLQERAITAVIAPSVIKITLIGSNSGGTGFLLETDKGTKLITNAHICRALEGGTGLAWVPGNTEPVMVTVDRISTRTDVCLMSGVFGVRGLTIGSQVSKGDHIFVVGHPQLDPTTIATGYVVSNSITELLIEEWSDKNIKQCVGPGVQIVEQPRGIFGLIGTMQLCLKMFNSYMLTAQIYPGNSGSPVINIWGNVVGIVFAGDNMTWKGRMVGIEEINRFLSE